MFRERRLAAALAGQRIALGMHCFSGSAAIVEAMAAGGLDFVIIDCEHSPNGTTEIQQCLRAAQSFDADALVRISVIDASIGMLLDLGIDGIVLSRASASRLQALLSESLYLPEGGRGACPSVRAAGYSTNDWSEFASVSNRDLLLIALVEDLQGVADIGQIAACPQVRALFVGAFDLAASLGVAATDLRHPELAAAFERVCDTARQHAKAVMVALGDDADPTYIDWLKARSVSVFSNGADVQIIRSAARRAQALRSTLTLRRTQ
ncbi:aldolase/citrate lyase family protein [soil metagenome]